MAIVNGTIGNDFIHVAGDGNVPPPGWLDNPGATNGDDVINPLDGNDKVFAGGGDDLINMGATFGASDELHGGDGYDTVTMEGDYSFGLFFSAFSLDSIEEIRLAAGFRYDLYFHNANVAFGEILRIDASALGAGDTLYIDTNDVTESGFWVRGGRGDDFLHGGAGTSAEFFAGNGNDFIESEAAYNTIDGGNGNDQITVRGTGASHVRGGAGEDHIDVEGTILLVDGGDGIDTIDLHGTIAGPVRGGAGNDLLNLFGPIVVTKNLVLPDLGIERLSLNLSGVILGSETKNVIDLTADMNDSLSALLRGLGGNDSLTGSSFGDKVYGDDGNDTLSGGAGGTDTLTGGAGNDTYEFGAGDVIVEQAGAAGGVDTLRGATALSLLNIANVERATLTGSGNVSATGNALANLLTGNGGANTLSGREGNDTLNSGDGADTLIGADGRDQLDPGAGADVVRILQVAHSTGPARDVVIGMNLAGEDVFDLSVVPTQIRPTVTTGTLREANFDADLAAAIDDAALPVGRAVLFDPDNGNLDQPGFVFLVVDANGVAGYQAGQDYVIELHDMTGTLSVSDFV